MHVFSPTFSIRAIAWLTRINVLSIPAQARFDPKTHPRQLSLNECHSLSHFSGENCAWLSGSAENQSIGKNNVNDTSLALRFKVGANQ